MEKIKKVNVYLEKFWLIIAILTALCSFYIALSSSWEGTSIYFMLSGLAWGVYFIRRGLRKRLEKLG